MYKRKNQWKKKKKLIKTYAVYVQPIVIRFATRLLWEAVLHMCSYEKVLWKTWSKFTAGIPMLKCDFNEMAALLKSHFSMGVLL